MFLHIFKLLHTETIFKICKSKNIIPPQKIFFCTYLLVMPKYWVKNYFAHGSFPEVGQKQKTEKKKKKKEREKERLNNGDNNGQATHGARKHAWRSQAAWAKKFKFHFQAKQLC